MARAARRAMFFISVSPKEGVVDSTVRTLRGRPPRNLQETSMRSVRPPPGSDLPGFAERLPVGAGCGAEVSSEAAAQVDGRGESDPGGDGLHGEIGLFQQYPCRGVGRAATVPGWCRAVR